MRETHYCRVCEKRLPFCVRTDREYCTARCRVWAFRHPGQRRQDYARGRVGLPPEPGRGRPKTLAEALAALEESRRYAATLQSTARQQHSTEQRLLTELATLRDGLAAVKHGLSAERDTARDDLAKTRDRLGKAEEQKNRKTRESHKRKRQTERLLNRLQTAEKEITKGRSELGRARADLAEARRAHAQQNTEHASRLREVQSQVAELSRARADLTKQIKALTATAEQLQNRAEQSEQTLKQRDEELSQERKQSTEAELLKRRLATEQERRIAAEQRIDELLRHLNSGRAAAPAEPPSPSSPPRDPGAYQRHAAAAGYDVTRDPLFDIMRRDVLIADRYADWQALHSDRVAARRRDPAQTLDEQAYAAALAVRWRLVDHPHLRLGAIPTWRILGCLLDERSESYLLTITQERLDEMQSRLGTGR